jgi:uncharacterized protein (TIRG00374 family)
LVISLLSLVIIFLIADIRRFIEALRLADYRIVGLVFVLTLAWLGVRGVVWRSLLQGKATLRQTFFTVNEGYLLNNLLPFRLGEVGRALLLSRKAGLEFWQVFSTVVIERALDVAFAVGILFTALPFVVGAAWARQAAIAAGIIVLIALFSLYLLARNHERVVNLFASLARRWPILQRVGSHQLASFLSGLSILNDFGQFARSIFFMALDWGVAIAQFYCLVLAFFPEAKILWGVFSLGVLALGVAAPSSPGALGVQELAMVGALSAFGLDPSTSLAAALTTHLANYLITGLLGVYALAQDGETLSGLYRRVRQLPQSQIPPEAS